MWKIGKYFAGIVKKQFDLFKNINSKYHCPVPDGIFVFAHYDGIIRKAIRSKYWEKRDFSEISGILKYLFILIFSPGSFIKERFQNVV